MAINRKKAKQLNPNPLVFVGALVVLISLAVLGFQLAGNISNLTGLDFSGAAVGDNWWNADWQHRTVVGFEEIAGVLHSNNVAEVTIDNINSKSDCSDIRVISPRNEVLPHSIVACGSQTTVRFHYSLNAKEKADFFIYYGNPNAQASGTSASAWEIKGSTLFIQSSPVAVGHQGKIYLIGGSPAADKIEVYDPTTDKWTAKKSAPKNIDAAASGALVGHNNRIYVIGGFADGDSTIYYSPLTDTWGVDVDAPKYKWAAAAVNRNDRIYVIGGRDHTDFANGRLQITALKTVEMLEYGGGKWFAKPEMPTGRDRLAAVGVTATTIHVLGGADASGNALSAHEVFDTSAQTWSSKQPIPIAVYAHTAVTASGKIYVIGGANSPRTLQIYDPASDTWTSGEQLPGGKSYGKAVAIANKIYVVGGDMPLTYVYTIPNWGTNISSTFVQETNPDFDDSVGAQETNDTVTNQTTTNQTTTQPEAPEAPEEGTILDQITGKDKSIKCPQGKVLVGTTCVDESVEEAVCGNNIREGDEMCDGAASQACPNVCTISCSCKYIPNDGVCDKDVGEKGEDCKSSTALWIGLALILLVIAGVVIYFKYHLDLEGFNLKSFFGRGGSSDSEVKSYISSTESMGYSKKQIAGALRKKGWSIDVIRKYLGGA
ncbi:MAG: hypothetical protein AABW84_00445 [Nanoarchaeota archaeon]|mgnify:CR=1 FL=1